MVKEKLSELLLRPKVKKYVKRFSIVLVVMLILCVVFWAPVTSYLDLILALRKPGAHDYFNYLTYSKMIGNTAEYKEVYNQGSVFCRMSIEQLDNYFTVYTVGDKVYLSFYEELNDVYEVDSSLLTGDKVKNLVDKKAEWIKKTYNAGVGNVAFLFNIQRYSFSLGEDDSFDCSPSPVDEIEASIGDKTIYAKNECSLLVYTDGDERYYLNNCDAKVSTYHIVGTVSTVEEFDRLIKENGIEKTFGDIFGE